MPNKARAAVAPSATVSGGRISASSCCSHQRQAAISPPFGLVVDSALAAADELEMLDRVGDVGALPVDAGLGQRAVEELAGGADERAAGQILLVAGLLADEQDAGVERAFAEHRLGGAFVEVAAGAAHRLGADRRPALPGIVADLRRPIAPTISLSRACAPLTSSPTNAVSGMFFQYFFGISLSIAPTFTRAGLKIEA